MTQTPESGQPVHVPQWSVGDRMAKARKDAGLSQEDMANRLGVKLPTVSTWERDFRQPREMLTVLASWAAICGVPRWWLIDGEGGLATSSDSDSTALEILEYHSLHLPMALPPTKTSPALAIVRGRD